MIENNSQATFSRPFALHTYLWRPVHGGEGVWGQVALRTHSECVGDAEKGSHAKDLGQVRPEPGEHEIG